MMDAEKRFQITYLQSECLLKYANKYKLSFRDCSILFQKFGIFCYLSENYDYVHLAGIDSIVRDIEKLIKCKGGLVYDKK